MRFVLASRSPRRREILGWLGVEFEAVEPEVEELNAGLDPEALVLENARRKANAGLALVAQRGDPAAGAADDLVVLGADTDVFLDGEMLGQPGDRAAAEERLRRLSGREHEVLTGAYLVGPRAGIPGGPLRERSGVARTTVAFHELDDETIDLYLDSGEWEGRAGGYAIQGFGSILIERIEGDFSNVVGLPIRLLLELDPALSRGDRPKP